MYDWKITARTMELWQPTGCCSVVLEDLGHEEAVNREGGEGIVRQGIIDVAHIVAIADLHWQRETPAT